jgi:ubiquinone/menaquinone biosynthesis C-methylase UbiE
MPRPASPSPILEWITRHTRPSASDSATLRFERMPSQSCASLPEVYVPLDAARPGHWHNRGIIWDYVISLEGSRRVLDVGPGDGWPALLLAPHFAEVVGIEPGPVRIAACRENARRLRVDNVRFEPMSACAMTFRDECFDGAVAASSIEQSPNPLDALREVCRVLRPGGVFRMSYEVLGRSPEPVSEAICVKRNDAGGYLIDYTTASATEFVQRDFLIEIVPATAGTDKRMALWAERCAQDGYPHRDPRLERGLTRTITSLGARDVRRCQTFRLRHFRPERVAAMLTQAGFTDVRLILGGGRPAGQIARERARAQRIGAAAPLMEELCRAAALIGLETYSPSEGQVIARKPAQAARRSSKRRA